MCRRAAFVLALMTLPVAVRAQGADAFAGEWRNLSASKPAIVGARVYQQNGRWMAQPPGSVHSQGVRLGSAAADRRYTSTDELTFVKAKAEPLPPMRRAR